MLSSCFVGLDPWAVIILTIVFTIIAIYLILISHQAEKKATYLSIGFIVITIFSLIFFTCWAVVVGLLVLILAFLINRDKLRILRLS